MDYNVALDTVLESVGEGMDLKMVVGLKTLALEMVHNDRGQLEKLQERFRFNEEEMALFLLATPTYLAVGLWEGGETDESVQGLVSVRDRAISQLTEKVFFHSYGYLEGLLETLSEEA